MCSNMPVVWSNKEGFLEVNNHSIHWTNTDAHGFQEELAIDDSTSYISANFVTFVVNNDICLCCLIP